MVSYNIFIDDNDKNELDEYKYLLMLDMTLEKLASFYPDYEIIKDYSDALAKYSKDGWR